LRDAALPKTEVARRAADVVDWDEVTSLRRWDRYYFTEESALRNSYRAVLSRYRDLAGRSDRLEAHLRDL
jgi:hypothetical protein